jgi:hypothetical protein
MYHFLPEGFCLKFGVLFVWGALSDERTGLQLAVKSLNDPRRETAFNNSIIFACLPVTMITYPWPFLQIHYLAKPVVWLYEYICLFRGLLPGTDAYITVLFTAKVPCKH